MEDIAEVLATVRAWSSERGIIRQSYHFTPVFDGPTSDNTMIYAEGFPAAWLALYRDTGLRMIDPIPTYTFKMARLTYWREALAACAELEGTSRYAEAMQAHGLVHGFGLPLYGPHSRNAYASCDFGRPMDREGDRMLLLDVRLIHQIAHQRLCVLLDREQKAPTLSERETEVLQWIVRGKSTVDICAILSISPETVRTYTQRIYSKFDTADRVGATVKALKLRLVEP
ncbi:autoinducer binding domain-containing protein [Alteriqipengyuania flavescens]|uniref:helix-turn-helix transcriptional regulator n=1 Tax=Alteriqipengyuania flavescens TaxID=3053610 RepID=UPI0025B59995|nr:LuxR family transcriptional regulator [Alteriqipengyuania flavescens]WJY18316.1 autoinducer binding domain-containing protein [Alteriqipengyuania flavescens]WJY24257.1 autoinducer binding domain-containing protein [Alteriqipengyuania flavescens]